MDINKVLGWTRTEHISGGADPTEMITWTKGELRIWEVFGDYYMQVPGIEQADADLVHKDLHKALEDLYDVERANSRDVGGAYDELLEVEAAERAAGWDPNP